MSTFSRRQFTAGLALAAVGAKTGAFGLGETTQQVSYTLEVCFHGLWVFLVDESTGWITARAFMDPFGEHCFVGGRYEDYSVPVSGPSSLQTLPSSMTLEGLPSSGSGDFDLGLNYGYGDRASWKSLQNPYVEVVLPYKPTSPVSSHRQASVYVIPQSGQPYEKTVSLSQHLSYAIDPAASVGFVDSNDKPSSFKWSPTWSPTKPSDDVHFFAGPPPGPMNPFHAIAALYGVLNARMGETSLVLPILQPAASVLGPDEDLDEITGFVCPSGSAPKNAKPVGRKEEAQKRLEEKVGKSRDAAQSNEVKLSGVEVANCMSIVCPG